LVDQFDEGATHAALILAAIRELIAGQPTIATKKVLAHVNRDDDLPFGEMRGGLGLDGRGIARLLKPYGIRNMPVRIGQAVARGYKIGDLQPVFDRYLPESTVTSVTGVTPPSHKAGAVTDVTHVTDPTGTETENGQVADADLEQALKGASR
jgi:hypothetical protein